MQKRYATILRRLPLKLASLFACELALASPVMWSLQDVTLSDGETVTGSFVLDADAGALIAVSIATSGGASWNSTTLVPIGCSGYNAPAGEIILFNSNIAPTPGGQPGSCSYIEPAGSPPLVIYQLFIFGPNSHSFTDAGGTIPITNPYSKYAVFTPTTYSSASIVSGYVISGTIPSIVGTWYGSWQDTTYPTLFGTEQFVVDSESSQGAISGHFTYTNPTACQPFPVPCNLAWSGTIDVNGVLNIAGLYGYTYPAQLSADESTISGTYTGPASQQPTDTGGWKVSRTPPDIALVEFLDGRSFISGGVPSANPGTLSQGGASVVGVGADGAARVLVRITSFSGNPLILSLTDSDSLCQSQELDSTVVGSLQDALAPSTAFASHMSVQPRSLGTGIYEAYVWYQAPSQYIRTACASSDVGRSNRALSLTVSGSGLTPVTQRLSVNRLPIVLVHGLWSDSTTWQESSSNGPGVVNMQTALQTGLSMGSNSVFLADYGSTSASWFSANATVVAQEIAYAVSSYLTKQKIAVVKADVIGHSMGGVLSRIWTEAGGSNCVLGGFYSPKNYCAGNINRLIIIGSPMLGSFWADLLSACSTPFAGGPGCVTLRSAMAAIDKPIALGAIDDLRTTSSALSSMRQNSSILGPPVHAIVGDVFPGGRPVPGLVSAAACPYPRLVCVAFLLADNIGRPSLPQLANTDTIVATSSQGGRLPGSDQSTPTQPTLPVPHFSIGGTPTEFAGETSNALIATELIRLLNEPTMQDIFCLRISRVPSL